MYYYSIATFFRDTASYETKIFVLLLSEVTFFNGAKEVYGRPAMAKKLRIETEEHKTFALVE